MYKTFTSIRLATQVMTKASSDLRVYEAFGYNWYHSARIILVEDKSEGTLSVHLRSPRWCSVLATGPKVHGFKPGQGDEFLRAIKIRSTPSFGWEVKPEVQCRKILRHVKDQLRYFRY
jgi:hypothetical protein